MKTILNLIIILAIITSTQGCKSGASWQNHQTSPANFADKPADHYFISVSVSWSDGSFDDFNKKSIRIYLANNTLDSSGSRSGKIFKDTWKIEGGKVTTKYEWIDDIVTVSILDATNNKVLLTKRIKINGKNATLLP